MQYIYATRIMSTLIYRYPSTACKSRHCPSAATYHVICCITHIENEHAVDQGLAIILPDGPHWVLDRDEGARWYYSSSLAQPLTFLQPQIYMSTFWWKSGFLAHCAGCILGNRWKKKRNVGQGLESQITKEKESKGKQVLTKNNKTMILKLFYSRKTNKPMQHKSHLPIMQPAQCAWGQPGNPCSRRI